MAMMRTTIPIHHDHRTLCGEFNGVTAWTKYAVVPARPFSSAAFNLYSALTRSPIFRSTHNPDGRAALQAEARRLRYLKERDFFVPDIFEQSENHLVISHVGTTMDTAIKNAPDAKTRRSLFCRAAAHIGDVHRRGEYHGRSVTKDLTIAEDKIGMIDLEHEPLRVMPLADAQARDAWLVFLSAAAPAQHDKTLIPAMLESYMAQAPIEAVDSLRKNTGLLNFVGIPVGLTLGAIHRNDTMSAMGRMNKELHRYLIS